MKRRTFLQSLGVAAALPVYGHAAPVTKVSHEATSLRQLFVEKNDLRIGNVIRSQLVEGEPWFVGGFPDQYGIYYVNLASWNISYLVAGWVTPESTYFQSNEVEERLNLAMRFLQRMQHADGTTDFVATNFHSPPDTAFLVEPLALALEIVRLHQPDMLNQFQTAAEDFLTNAGEALARGGVHTPNHRWVVCMALARINHLLPNSHLIERIDQWLAEGIDIDSDGQFTERSTSAYSPLIDRCFLTMARLLDRPALYDPVRQNLETTRYLIRPNGELVTEISRRQDQFKLSLATNYYYPYCYMARLDNNGLFAATAHQIETAVGRENLFDQFIYSLESSEALEPLPPAAKLPTNYQRYFPRTGIVRIRRGDLDASIIAQNSTLFSLHKGGAVLQSLRLASAFFGKGQFVSSGIEPLSAESRTDEQQSGGYLLTQHLSGPYVQPLPAELLTGDGDWTKMPHARRAKSEVQQLTTKITILESNGQFRIHFDIQGTDHVPWAIELGLRAGGTLTGGTPLEGVENAFLAGDKGVSYQVGTDTLHFSPGPSEHRWTQLRGALPKLDAMSVYLTGFTPLDFELTIS